MKCANSVETIFKDVVIIGNGPSGIALSYMLSGNIPYVTSNDHPDEFLSARLSSTIGQSLLQADLEYLANGLEGRTTNPVSLLLDSLLHPYADIGYELASLVEWRKNGEEIDHVVLGKGPPGGSWHAMDPQILTLSLGSWMALPGLKYDSGADSEKRTSAKNVAEYYEKYVSEMNLTENFQSNVLVTSIKPFNEEIKQSKWVEIVKSDICQKVKLCSRPEPKENELKKSRSCTLSNAFNYILNRNQNKCTRRHKELTPKSEIIFEDNRVFDNCIKYKGDKKDRSISFSCDTDYAFSDVNYYTLSSSYTNVPKVPIRPVHCDCHSNQQNKWVVEAYDAQTRSVIRYVCNNLVLANGSSDLPNRLGISDEVDDPYWLMHDLRSLEIELDLHMQTNANPDPVLIVGAGLSAADAIIATRGRNIPILHMFRNRNANLSRQLPENMYPEYHKVHQMMTDGSTYPLYTALAEYSLTSMDESTHTVTLTSKEGKQINIKVSFAAVLIGSRPDLGFIPNNYNLGVKKQMPIDCKKNNININKLTHGVRGYEGLYAVGPLSGDNFVRFLPGGALAILCDLYRKNNY